MHKLSVVHLALACVLAFCYQPRPASAHPEETDAQAKRIQALIKKLYDPNPEVREKSAAAIAFYGNTKAVCGLIDVLKDTNVPARVSAATALGRIGPRAGKAVPALTAALNDKDKNVRQAATTALGKIGHRSNAALPSLIHLLTDDSSDVRAQAATALGAIRADPKRVARALTRPLVEDANPLVRASAAHALGCLGDDARPAVPALLHAFNDSDELVRAAAVGAFGAIRPFDAESLSAMIEALKTNVKITRDISKERQEQVFRHAVRALIEALKDKDVKVRRQAAHFFSSTWAKGNEGAIANLIDALKDTDDQVRQLAAAGLSNLRAAAEPAVPALISALDDRNQRVRLNAAHALGQIGPRAEPAIPALAKILMEKDDKLREEAVATLSELGPAAVSALIEGLKDKDCACHAVRALWKMGPAARDATPALTATLQDGGLRLHKSVLEALGRIGPEANSAVPAIIDFLNGFPAGKKKQQRLLRLIDALDDNQFPIRARADEELRKLGQPALIAVCQALTAQPSPEARWRLQDIHDDLAKAEREINQAAVVALGNMGPGAHAALPTLSALLRDKTKDVTFRQTVARTLCQIDKIGSAEVLAALSIALKDENRDLRYNAALTLDIMGESAQAAIPALIEALKDEDRAVRAEATYALRALGRKARAALPALVERLRDDPEDWRAAEALRRIDPEAATKLAEK